MMKSTTHNKEECFKFFDKAFIAKPYGKTDFVSNMSDMVEFIKEKL